MHDPTQDPLHEEQQSTEQVFDGKLLHVFRDQVRLPDGRTGLREYVRHPGAVVVIPVCEDGTLIFERQFRYPLRRAFLELPAGKSEKTLSAAQYSISAIIEGVENTSSPPLPRAFAVFSLVTSSSRVPRTPRESSLMVCSFRGR